MIKRNLYINAILPFINQPQIKVITGIRRSGKSSLLRLLEEEFKKLTKLNSIDFSISGRNLMLWTKIKGIDPEVNQSGVDNGFGVEYFTNPSTRSWVFSAKINF